MVREALNTVTGHPMTILQYQPREIEKALQGFSIPGFFAKAEGYCKSFFNNRMGGSSFLRGAF